MPLSEISDSLKAKLYDFRYSPFLISFLISLAIYNYRFLMILFADNIDLDIKFDKLDNESIGIANVLIPFGLALFYTGVYPIFGNWLYEVTLKYKNDAKKRKIKAESLTIKTKKEYEILEKEKNKLVWDLEEKEKELSIIRKLYEEKIKSFDENINAEKNKITDEYNKIKENLEEEARIAREHLIQTLEENKDLKAKKSNTTSLKKENIALKNQIKKLELKRNETKVTKNDFDDNIPKEYQDKYSEDEIRILKIIYINDIKERTSREILMGELKKYIEMPRIKILNIISGLFSKDVMKTDTAGYYYITIEGKKDMVEMFDHNK